MSSQLFDHWKRYLPINHVCRLDSLLEKLHFKYPIRAIAHTSNVYKHNFKLTTLLIALNCLGKRHPPAQKKPSDLMMLYKYSRLVTLYRAFRNPC